MSKINDLRKKLWVDRTPLELCITQSPRPQIRAKAAEELAALREAGEKMAKQLREMRDYTGGTFTLEDAASLAEWEAANK